VQYHTLKIVGLTRKLPLIQVGRSTKIASFSILGDVELVDKLALKMAKDLTKYKFDYLVGPEVKVVPLIQKIAEILGHKRFMVCRKSIKTYMTSPVIVKPLSHFPKHIKPLVLNGPDAKLLENKKVAIIDDVLSTGVTMRMISHLMEKVGAKVVVYSVAIKQGETFDKFDNLLHISTLPIFKDNHQLTTHQLPHKV